jgi:hypothetical protein
MIDKTQVENMEYLNYLDSMMINDANCTRENKYRIVMAKSALIIKKPFFNSKFDVM